LTYAWLATRVTGRRVVLQLPPESRGTFLPREHPGGRERKRHLRVGERPL